MSAGIGTPAAAPPRLPGTALLGIIVCTLALVLAWRLGDLPADDAPVRARVQAFELTFRDRADGAVLVAPAGGPGNAHVIERGTHNFLRGVVRGLARERRLRGLGPEIPFVLARWSDGALTLDDPATGRRIELAAFGSSNVREFSQLLPAPRDP